MKMNSPDGPDTSGWCTDVQRCHGIGVCQDHGIDRPRSRVCNGRFVMPQSHLGPHVRARVQMLANEAGRSLIWQNKLVPLMKLKLQLKLGLAAVDCCYGPFWEY